MLLPLIHPDQLRPDAGSGLVLYHAVAVLVFVANLGVILAYRAAERDIAGRA